MPTAPTRARCRRCTRREMRRRASDSLATRRWNDRICSQVLDDLAVMVRRMRKRVDDQPEAGTLPCARQAWNRLHRVLLVNRRGGAVQAGERAAQIVQDFSFGTYRRWRLFVMCSARRIDAQRLGAKLPVGGSQVLELILEGLSEIVRRPRRAGLSQTGLTRAGDGEQDEQT